MPSGWPGAAGLPQREHDVRHCPSQTGPGEPSSPCRRAGDRRAGPPSAGQPLSSTPRHPHAAEPRTVVCGESPARWGTVPRWTSLRARRRGWSRRRSSCRLADWSDGPRGHTFALVAELWRTPPSTPPNSRWAAGQRCPAGARSISSQRLVWAPELPSDERLVSPPVSTSRCPGDLPVSGPAGPVTGSCCGCRRRTRGDRLPSSVPRRSSQLGVPAVELDFIAPSVRRRHAARGAMRPPTLAALASVAAAAAPSRVLALDRFASLCRSGADPDRVLVGFAGVSARVPRVAGRPAASGSGPPGPAAAAPLPARPRRDGRGRACQGVGSGGWFGASASGPCPGAAGRTALVAVRLGAPTAGDHRLASPSGPPVSLVPAPPRAPLATPRRPARRTLSRTALHYQRGPPGPRRHPQSLWDSRVRLRVYCACSWATTSRLTW